MKRRREWPAELRVGLHGAQWPAWSRHQQSSPLRDYARLRRRKEGQKGKGHNTPATPLLRCDSTPVQL